MKTLVELATHFEHIQLSYRIVHDLARRVNDKKILVVLETPNFIDAIHRHDSEKIAARLADDETAYYMHDAYVPHHAACWIVLDDIPFMGFVEHIIDHVAVQLDHGEPSLLCIDQFMNDFPFHRVKEEIPKNDLGIKDEASWYAAARLSRDEQFRDTCGDKDTLRATLAKRVQHVILLYRRLVNAHHSLLVTIARSRSVGDNFCVIAPALPGLRERSYIYAHPMRAAGDDAHT